MGKNSQLKLNYQEEEPEAKIRLIFDGLILIEFGND
jgi:hypothetical protein